MKILYLSRAIAEKNYDALERKGNPSNQNFHLRMMKALSLHNEVHCLSLHQRESTVESGIYFHYLQERGGIKGYMPYVEEALKVKGDIIVHDSLNLKIAKAASIIRKNLQIPNVSILTDSPHNISGAPFYYPFLCLHFNKKADAYLSLSKGLDDLFHKGRKPSFNFLGIVDEEEAEPYMGKRPYIYYGGALYEKDGSEDLLDSYLKYRPAYDLLISGHGPYEAKIKEAASSNKAIIYLGQVSRKENAAYEAGASLLVNPRLYDEELEKVSVPSKVLEYLSLGNYVAATKHQEIESGFGKHINWIKDMDSFFAEHLDEKGTLKGLIENKAQATIKEELGTKHIGEKICDFLDGLKNGK